MEATKYGNNILAEFDSLIDVNYGVLRLVQIKYNNEEYIKKHILDADSYVLRCLLLQRKDYNPLYIALKDEYIDNAEDLYNEIIENEYKDVLKYTIPNSLFELMKMYRQTDGVINVTVLCKNEIQEQYIKQLNKDMPVFVGNYEDINTDKYDSYFVDYYPNILKFGNKEFEAKSIFIPKYAYNLDKGVAGEDVPIIPVSGLIADVNKVYIISPFSDFETPADEMIENNDSKE